MKYRSIIVIITALTLLGSVTGFSQDAGDNEKEIEDIYLENPEILVVERQVYSDDRQTQIEALAIIETFLNNQRSGKAGDNESPPPIPPDKIPAKIEELLIYLGAEGSITKKYSGNRLINNFPEVRRKACELLGWIRTERSKEALIKFLINDEEPMVKAEAAWALGEYAHSEGDNDGEISKSLAWVIERESKVNPDNNLAYAVVLSLQKISEKHKGRLTHPNGYTALIKIAQGNYIKTVRNKALEVIQDMKQK
ncbi:MAG: HEAT repeat domain-containing protein [Spirochaetales bacterium]|nr:HEAT repeat domain-containing protein [Spirochaetales bacterium]